MLSESQTEDTSPFQFPNANVAAEETLSWDLNILARSIFYVQSEDGVHKLLCSFMVFVSLFNALSRSKLPEVLEKCKVVKANVGHMCQTPRNSL